MKLQNILNSRSTLVLLAVVLACLSIDGRSLWTDELGTWALTQSPTWTDWITSLWHHYNSDAQMPLFNAYMRAWTMAFGDAEWIMRASNVLWLILMLWGLSRMRIPGVGSHWFVLVAVLNAFVWHYLNEARPYMMLVAGASWAACGVFRIALSDKQDKAIDTGLKEFLFGSVLMVSGTILGAFWILSSMVAVGLCYPANFMATLKSAWRHKRWVLLALLVGGSLLINAVHANLSDASAGQTGGVSLGGMAYGLMELLGAAGLGPSRNELRTHPSGVPKFQLAGMLLLSTIAGLACVSAWWQSGAAQHRVALLLGAALPLLGLVAAGIVLEWRVVGRHFSALLPIIVVAMACFLSSAFSKTNPAWRFAAWALILGWAASSLSIRWADRHLYDDYRQASQWAQQSLAQGRSVLWIADSYGLRYYHLTRNRQAEAIESEVITFHQFPEASRQTPWPQVVIFSPRDGVDPLRLARPVLDSGRYKATATATTFIRYELR